MTHVGLFLPDEERVKRLKIAATRMGGNAALGRALGYVDGAYIGQMLRGERPITEHVMKAISDIRKLADLFSFSAHGGFALPANDQASDTAPAPGQVPDSRGVAHLKILDESTVPRMIWGDLMEIKTLPPSFDLEMPDDAMAPHTPRGMVLTWETGKPPEVGHGVIVRAADGRYYVRRYGELPSGQWEAQARNDAFATLHSERDGLVVVATLKSRADPRM